MDLRLRTSVQKMGDRTGVHSPRLDARLGAGSHVAERLATQMESPLSGPRASLQFPTARADGRAPPA